MIAPAMTLAIYYFVFSVILSNDIPHFVIYLFAGLLLWNLFSAGRPHRHRRRRQQRRHREEGGVPARDPRPGVGGHGLCVLLLPVHRAGHLHGRPAAPARPGRYLPLLLLALVAGVVLAGALAVLLSAVNVYLRDTQHLIEVVLTAWFWACPIVYAYQANIGNKLGPQGPDLGVLPQPDDAAGPDVPAVHLRARRRRRRPRRSALLPSCRRKGMLWYVGLDLVVLLWPASCSSSRWPCSAASRATSPRSSRR